MASIILGVGGTVALAPLGPAGMMAGGMLGSMVGGFIDGELFKGPKPPVQGRLTDTMISGAAYGQPILLPYGLVRGGGELIFSTPLQEVDISEGGGGGGKGSPSLASASVANYYASFAYAIGQGPITDLLRVWFNGACVYDNRQVSYDGTAIGSPGNMTAAGNVTLAWYPGNETQNPDPTIEAYMGVGYAPAYRGTAYVVFSGVNVTPYGNTIPNVTLEYVGDIGSNTYNAKAPMTALSADVVVSDICTRAGLTSAQFDVSQLTSMQPAGYLVTGQGSFRSIVQQLQACYFFDGIESDWRLLV